MSLATLIRRMTEAGAPPEAIALAVEEIEAIQEMVDSRKAQDRERKREQREREKSANVTGHSEDSHGTVTGQSRTRVSLDKKPPNPKKLIPSHVCETRARPAYHRLPDGWQPMRPIPIPLQAKIDQWPPGVFDDEVAAFKRWAANAADQAGKGRKLDWDKALWNWLGRRHDEQHRRTNGMGRARPNLTDQLRAATAASRDLADRDRTGAALPAIGNR